MPAEDSRAQVVIVDDEHAIVSLICDMLQDEDIPCLTCSDSRVGYRLIYEHQPRVVVLDVQMPKVDGIQIFEQLRAEPTTAQIPVIFLTANVHILYERLPSFPSMGAVVLPKPFNVFTLLSQVQQYLTLK